MCDIGRANMCVESRGERVIAVVDAGPRSSESGARGGQVRQSRRRVAGFHADRGAASVAAVAAVVVAVIAATVGDWGWWQSRRFLVGACGGSGHMIIVFIERQCGKAVDELLLIVSC